MKKEREMFSLPYWLAKTTLVLIYWFEVVDLLVFNKEIATMHMNSCPYLVVFK